MDATQIAWLGVMGTIAVAAISSITTLVVSRRPASITADAARKTAEAAVQAAINGGFAELTRARDEENRKLEAKLDVALTVLRSLCSHLGEIETFVRSNGITDLPPRPPEITEFMLDAGLAWPPADFSVIKGGKQ